MAVMTSSRDLLVYLMVLVLLLLGLLWPHGQQSDVRVIMEENWRQLLEGERMIKLCKDGKFRRCPGPRTKKDYINVLSGKEWKNIEPVLSWFGRDSVLYWFSPTILVERAGI